jgi:hypothetical protein
MSGAPSQPPADGVAAAIALSEGAFRMGAQAMREAIAIRFDALGHDFNGSIADGVPIPAYLHPKQKESGGWAWWAGLGCEYFTAGPFVSRADAVEVGAGEFDGDGFHILEAAQHQVRFSAERLIESQYFEDDDFFSGEHSDPDRIGGADVIKAADAELQALLDWWAARWRHTFVQPEMFAVQRNAEWIEPTAVEPVEVAE